MIIRLPLAAAICMSCLTMSLVAENPPFRFRDVTQELGLAPEVEGIRGHGAAWGDVDGDGRADLYVGTFHTNGSKPNMFFRNGGSQFRLDEQADLRISTRATGIVFADLDGDGDLDLFVASMPAPKGSRLAEKEGHALSSCSMFRNEGHGEFTDVSSGNGACPPGFGGRSVAVLDLDSDGFLDLLVGEDPLPGYNGSTTKSSRLFLNRGKLQFDDVSRVAGLPEGVPGLGVAAGDLNNDGFADLFLTSSGDGNRLFVNDRHGHFVEPAGLREVFTWSGASKAGGENMVCGVCFGDVNRDGWMDVVLGQHFSTPWIEPVANRLYLNGGVENGALKFTDITDAAGLVALPMKAPHVEIQDFDNDGWPDISTSLVKFSEDKSPHPVIFRHLGLRDGLPRFQVAALGINDFPTSDDRAVRSSTKLFDKMIRERKIMYSAPGPICDFDNDGRLDMFMPNWWIESRSMLLRNETPGGNWLDVQVAPPDGVNRMGIGTRIDVFPAGKLGDTSARLGGREIAVGFGYASGQAAIAHFGLGAEVQVDIEIVWPHGRGKVARAGVKANQRLVVGE